MAFHEDSSGSGHDEPWIQWFCGLKGHEMFCEVERSYIEDGFNLYGLRTCVSNFSDCLDLILDRIGPDDSDDSHLTQNACTLYGLIHARYIITAHGLDAMYNKYANKEFGTCPLIQCSGQPVLPVGLKDEIGADTVKIFCPKCQCVYHPPPVRSRSHGNPGPSAGVDGASFGTTFPHLFLMTFSNLVPDPLPKDSTYIPRVFGFRVHKSARLAPSATTASPTQMIVARRSDNVDNLEDALRNQEAKGDERLIPLVNPIAVRIDDERFSNHSGSKRQSRYQRGEDEGEADGRKRSAKEGAVDENGGIGESKNSSKRRKLDEP